ncbi:hypothetical protein DH2020_010727 [Rehmannia glutinosa]|uniref:Auxin efflux carrier component n=1 Tax=Rehmannia glutinosa TaxID=99300 RepID=A0ABR0XBG4_REHGL
MIGWEDIYKVVVSMVPLYVALGLGYASVKWWRMFKPDQCDAINRFNCYFILPFFTFHFTSGVNPYRMNYRFLAGDVIAKAIAGATLALWANLWREGNFSWAITSFSLSSLNNTLVVGVPLLGAMYGPVGQDLVVQSSVIQALLWFPLLLFMLEFRRSVGFNSDDLAQTQQQQKQSCSDIEIVVTDDHVNTNDKHENQNNTDASIKTESTLCSSSSYNMGSTIIKVLARLARNPNSYACALGLIWALLEKRWKFEMPSIVEGSVMIMAKAGSGVAMFSMGLFMALQKKVIACGVRLSMYGMLLRFVGGPLTTAIGSLALGLRSNILRIAIIQSMACTLTYSALRRVIFGTIVSLPLLIAYYAVLDVLHI